MSVPAIALYTSPPQIPSSPDYDFSSRPASIAATSPPSSKPMAIGGLSCLFSSPSALRHNDELSSSLWHERSEEHNLCSSFSYSSSLKSREHSPVSVFQGPVSSGSVSSSRIARDRLFKGFVMNALGSCLNYESPSLQVDRVCSEDIDELAFNLEDTSLSCEDYAKDLLARAQARHKIFEEENVVQSFYEAEKAHRGQMRASGDPYLQHCVETAVLLAKIGANSTVVAAGLMHDMLDDSFMEYGYIFQMFGKGVADLVKGVSELSHLSKLARENDTATRTVEADRLHTLFLAMADARAVLIKLADRLHNMMTLEALPLSKQRRFAKETLEIFVPLANRLGISTWKEQLENLCFKHLYPEQHDDLSYQLMKSFDEAIISSAIERLEEALKDKGISYHVLYGRYKSLYSIFSKMRKKKLTMDEIHDIYGLRLIVEEEEDCYRALDAVHQLWPKVVGSLKDYINHPKFNGYKSLHTVILDENEVPLEVQIRTKQMHLQAELGFAAHWRYKEGDSEHSSFILQMVEWARWVLTWHCETMNSDKFTSLGASDSIQPSCSFPSHSDDCPFSYAHQCKYDGPIFVIVLENEKMSVQEFPANSTIMDMLERAGRGSSRWPSYGFPINEDLRPRLNKQPVSYPNQKLKMGDVIELTPTIPDKSLPVYREEIQRMYNRGAMPGLAIAGLGGWRS